MYCGRTDGRTYVLWTNGRKDVRTDGSLSSDRRTEEHTDGRTEEGMGERAALANERTDGLMAGGRTDIHNDGRTDGRTEGRTDR